MAGLNRHTLQPLGGIDHAIQSVEVILSTRLRSRVMLRHFGGGVVEFLGPKRSVRLSTLLKQIIGTAIDLWEPRFKVRQVRQTGTADELALGHTKFVCECDYRPKGHLGEFTVERVVTFGLFSTGVGGLQVVLG